ncbi:uncharacterized protein TRUGW13939_11206 [Talaromyces rugulosus]|uniref:BTB domain-containing protein n=1 Tax=Talaromyces rugulosus TaxID=121627 RepID=A0A7H8RHH6_TALRU|nr:uncharacterized protein TRUGW13939_11206 [Talaromyces rugulosus]QKX64033.1 hypothetical protein TRUGW13939_11206 [Talaromyces rugulosus]
MDSPTHVIDPDGEVVIVLLNADSPFAEMSEDMFADGYPRTVSELDGEIEYSENHMDPPEPIPPPTEDLSVAEEPIHTEEPVSAEESSPAEWPVEQLVGSGLVPESLDRACFRIQVSAKHLMLASSVFRKLLTGGWKESVTYSGKNPTEITAEDWDIEALLILLRAIHGQQYQIPQKLTLEMLAKVAVLADYYKCKEAVYVWTTAWIDALEKERPETYSRDLFLWLWISWFFQLPTQFEETTSTIMTCSNGVISNLGLPIPDQE